MKIEKIKIEGIKPYKNNAKEHPREQIEQIKKSILEFGFDDPLAIDENNEIIEGHGRYLALLELEYKEIEVIKLEHLTEEQKKAYRLGRVDIKKISIIGSMNITKEQLKRITPYLSRRRGKVIVDNLTLVNAILYIAQNGCKWRSLPSSYGKWYTVYKRVNRWAKNGVLENLFLSLQKEQIATLNIKVFSLDSTCIKVHPNGCGALKKKGNKV